MRTLAFALAFSPLGLAACGLEAETLELTGDGTAAGVTPDPTTERAPWDAARPFVAIAGERFFGDIGSSRDLDLPSDLAFVSDDGWDTRLEVYARRPDGIRVMVMLSIHTDDGQEWFRPGLGVRFRPGDVGGASMAALGCEGVDTGNTISGGVLSSTSFDELPCEVGVDTERDPEDPEALLVTLRATFADGCADSGDPSGDAAGLPDLDGDGDGDLPAPGEPGSGGAAGDDGVGDGLPNPLTATVSFRLMQ